jgi:hypothetical protein
LASMSAMAIMRSSIPPRTTKWGSVQGNRYNAEFKVPTGREVAIKDLDLPTGITVRNAAQQRAQQFCG